MTSQVILCTSVINHSIQENFLGQIQMCVCFYVFKFPFLWKITGGLEVKINDLNERPASNTATENDHRFLFQYCSLSLIKEYNYFSIFTNILHRCSFEYILWNPSYEATTLAPEKWPFKRVGLTSGWPLKRGSTVLKTLQYSGFIPDCYCSSI